ncbi:hypothetical protein EG832_01250 [bacterium]|nr:hypothetical protein [bacterium]
MGDPNKHNKAYVNATSSGSLLNLFRFARHATCRTDIIFITCLLFLCITTIYIGAVPTHKFGHDTFFILDNSWRVVNGQRTHLDYTSAWGPLSFIIFALGLKLSHYTVNGIGYGTAIFGLIIGLWSYSLGRDRLQSLTRVLFSLFMVGLVIAPYALSYGVLATTHAMVYNRFGYALLGLILLESMQLIQYPQLKTAEWMDGFSTGVAVALTFFLKISYFFAAILLIGGISIISKRFDRKRLYGLILGFSLISIAFLYYLDFDLQAIFHDLQMAAGARSESLPYYHLLKKFTLNAIYLPAVILFSYASMMAMGSKQNHWKNLQLPLTGALVFVADIFLIFTNQQWFEPPLIASFILIVLNNVTAHSSKEQNKGISPANRRYIILLLVGAALFLPIFVSQYVALAHGAMEKKNPPDIESVTRFKQPFLTDLLLYEGEQPSSNGRQYTTNINEGVALLQAVSKKHETVQTIDMFNPFPFALGRKPPTGGIAAAAYKYTFSENHRPSDVQYFGNADIVMVPRKPAAVSDYYGIMKIYEPALKESFFLAEQSDLWCLYRRKK